MLFLCRRTLFNFRSPFSSTGRTRVSGITSSIFFPEALSREVPTSLSAMEFMTSIRPS